MNKPELPRWTRFDTGWTLSLFGTAVGAGILFLPISAGRAGFYTMLLMAALVGPMTFFAHRGLARFVLSSSRPGSDITQVVEEHFGTRAGKFITLLYFLAIYPILLIYGVGLTNTVESFLVHQLGLTAPPRALLSLLLVGFMMGIILTGERLMIRVTTWMVYPLCGILLFLSLYLIPFWNSAMLRQVPPLSHSLTGFWTTVPVLVFAFNHSPAISSFTQAVQRQNGEHTEEEASRILRMTSGILLLFVMFFVFSCVLALTPDDLDEARRQNISILSYLANRFDSPLISYPGPLIAFLAIASSFFGHYLGAREGLRGILLQHTRTAGKTISPKLLSRGIPLFFFITIWLAATVNPGILGMIEALGGPVIALILCIMPMYAIHTIPAMQRYKGAKSNIFVTVMGCIAISATLYSLFGE